MLRLVRIVGFASLLALAFRLSREASAAWGNEDVPGFTAAVGVVTLLFLVRAMISEFSPPKGRPVALHERDILWGISLGAFVTVIARLVA